MATYIECPACERLINVEREIIRKRACISRSIQRIKSRQRSGRARHAPEHTDGSCGDQNGREA